MATTYTVNFNIPAATTGSASQYPQLFLQSSGGYTEGTSNKNPYMPDSTIYIKRGDTIEVRPTNTAEANDVRQALSAVASEPDPTSPTSWPVNDATIHTYTWPTNATDLETKWYYFGKPQDGSGNYQRSGFVRINAVKIDAVTVSNSGQVAASGGTLTVAITGLAGLLSASGNNDNRLFVHVRNSSGTLITSNVSFSTATNNAYLGRFSTSTTSCTLTVGAALAQDTYTIRVGPYGGDGSGSGDTNNPFYGTANSFTVTGSFTKNAPAADTTPNAFDTDLGADPVAPVTANTTFESNIVTLSGTDANANISVNSGSGSGSPQYKIRANSSSAFSAYTANAGQIQPGYQFQMRYTSGSAGQTVTPTITIGGVSGSISATSQAAATGSSSDIGVTSSDYGIQIFNSAGTDIFGVNKRTSSLIKTGTLTLTTSNTPVTITGVEGLVNTAANKSTHPIILVSTTNSLLDSSRVTVSRGTNQFTLTLQDNGDDIGLRYYVLRF